MGTDRQEKQHSIQHALNTLGWSHYDLANVLYDELNQNDDFKDTDSDEIKKLSQSLKKQLSRSSCNDPINLEIN